MDPIAPFDPIAAGSVGTSSDSQLTDAATEEMGRDEFLKLLMAQLEHQDPMSPVENHEFVAQLATFSGLEQQIMANTRLQELQLAQMSASNAQLAGFIGKEVTAAGDQISISGTRIEPIGIQLQAAADSATITVKNETGEIVYSGERTNLQAGNHQITWPGTDENGSPLPDGVYSVEVSATAGGEAVAASAVVEGVVTGVSFDNGYPELLIGELRIEPADILSIGEGGTESPTPTPDPQEDPSPGPSLGG